MRQKWMLGAVLSALTLSMMGIGAPTASFASSASSSRAASGGTVTLGSIQGTELASVLAQNKAGFAAAVKAVNAAGGINGAKVKVKVCIDDSDANVAAKCASDFAADPSVPAVVGMITNFGDTVDPVLEKNNVPAVGATMLGLSDFKSPMIFPVDGGSITGVAADGPVCINDLKKKTMSLAYLDVAAGAQLIPVMDNFVLKPFDTKLTTSVPIPATAADLSSQAAQLVSDNADCISQATGREQHNSLIRALKQQGYKGKIFVGGAVHNASSLKSDLGALANGAVLVGSYDLNSPGYKQFVKDMKASAGSKYQSLLSDQSAKAWLAVKMFADEAKKAGSNERAAVLSTLQAETGYDTKGMLKAPLDFTARKPNPAVFAGLAPNLILPYAIAYNYKNGKLTPVSGKWADAFGGPA